MERRPQTISVVGIREFLLRYACWLLLPVVLAPCLNASDWPQYQGNAAHTGYNPDCKMELPLELKWSAHLCNPGRSNHGLTQATVADGYVYTSSTDPDFDESAQMWCLDASTGEVSWTQIYGYGPQEVMQPSADNGQLYVQLGGANHTLLGLEPLTGDTIWQTDYEAQNNYALAPAVSGGLIYICGNYTGGMTCLAARTGLWLWDYSMIAIDSWTPAVYGDTLFTWVFGEFSIFTAFTGQRVFHAYADLYNPGKSPEFVGLEVVPVVDGPNRRVYLVHEAELLAIDLNSRELAWSVWDDCCHRVNPAVFDGMVYSMEYGRLCLRDGATGTIERQFMPDDPIDPFNQFPPVIADGLVFVSSTNWVYALDAHTLDSLWSYNVGGELSVANGYLMVASNGGDLYAFSSVVTDVDGDPDDALPNGFELGQNYPNPFNSSTTITFDLERRALVTLSVYNILGQQVRTLLSTDLSAGSHSIAWDGVDDNGRPVSTGVYLYRLESGDQMQVKKMLFLK